MKRIAVWAVWGAVAALVSCAGGTETDNPAATLTSFESSGCKNRNVDEGQQGLVLESDAQGLQCVVWDLTARGSLAIRLLNFPEPCGETYLGRATLGASALELSVHKDTCLVSRCGTCVFDFDFEVAGIAVDAPLRVKLGAAVCETQPTTFDDELTLPLDEAPSGSWCRPLARGVAMQYGAETGTCGERNMPCGDCNSADLMSCGADLSCSDAGDGDFRCLAACASDDDCEGGLTQCSEGLCQASNGF